MLIEKPMDVLSAFPVRKNKQQKENFRSAVIPYIESLGYSCKVEKGSFGTHNVVFGDPEKAKILITAHYDTCAHLPFPNLITPCNIFYFLLYQIFVMIFFMMIIIPAGVISQLVFHNSDVTTCVLYAVLFILSALMMYGPANKNNANDNTSGVVAVLEIARSLPDALKDKVCFVLFDLEEAGLIGSAAYYKKHKKTAKNQIVFNLDCVGDGDDFVFFPKGKLRRNSDLREWLREATLSIPGSTKKMYIREKGFAYFPSDQEHFPYGLGVASLQRSKLGCLYLGRVHTNRDVVLNEDNIAFLSQKIICLINSFNGSLRIG